ncbi:MAG TPA: hypothetical protein VF708_19995 [Pyrinomonadaceae bacterium]|jgi:hypothetical protein
MADTNQGGAMIISGGGLITFISGILAWTQALVVQGLPTAVEQDGSHTFRPGSQNVPDDHLLLARGRTDQQGLRLATTSAADYTAPELGGVKFDIPIGRHVEGGFLLFNGQFIPSGNVEGVTLTPGPVRTTSDPGDGGGNEVATGEVVASHEVDVQEDSFVDPESPVYGKRMTVDELNLFERRMNLEGVKDPENFLMPDGKTTLADVQRSINERGAERRKVEVEQVNLIRREQMEQSTGNEVIVTMNRSGVLLASTPADDPRDMGTGTDVLIRSTTGEKADAAVASSNPEQGKA